ncbi:MAG TPA: DUF924 family protein [Rhizomicrobium sp.]|nr:DUF924 family protein [Rhizomicrobium sp.]
MNARSSISSGIDPEAVIDFWRAGGPKMWFAADTDFDRSCRQFEDAHLLAARGGLTGWEGTAPGALALVLLADQIPRNIYRGSAHAFATDPLALAVADRALARGFDTQTAADLRMFFYLPFEHHEDAQSQARALALFETLAAQTGDPVILDYARLHRDLIARFGRFPHRNAVLGRTTTAEEAAYLAQGGFAG